MTQVNANKAGGSLESWLKLQAIDGVGDRTLLALLREWENPDAVLCASIDELMERGCSAKLARLISQGPDTQACRHIDRQLNGIRLGRIMVCTILDAAYPVRLRMIQDPPPLVYMSGSVKEEDELALAVVGARRATEEGCVVTEGLAKELAAAGFTIVSGLARGVDAAAHRGALAARGRTIAVLGCGIDQTYPPEHERLRREIEAQGAIVSEFPFGTPPHSKHFPRRNRIISGLSLGVVVTEAAVSSGSLITAGLAADQGREVFAVPGFVNSAMSRGTNALIKQGAALIERAEDVIESIIPQLDERMRSWLNQTPKGHKKNRDRFGNKEQLVYDALSHAPSTVDHLVEHTGLDVPEVVAALLSLELGHHIRQLPGQRYLKV